MYNCCPDFLGIPGRAFNRLPHKHLSEWEAKVLRWPKDATPVGLRDVKARARIRNRIARIEELGAFGDCDPVGEGVLKFRFFFGPGYRIYYGQTGNRIVLILCGGSRGMQSRDVRRAKQLFDDYLQRRT